MWEHFPHIGLASGAVWDRLFRKEFGNREFENPDNYRKLTDLGLNPGKSALTGFSWIEKGGLGGLELFWGPKTPKNGKKSRKVRDFWGKVPMTWISPLIWGETILKFRTGG